MRIIALDPGYDRCGIAVIECDKNRKETLLESACITTNRADDFEKRLLFVTDELRAYIKKYNPEVCTLETLFFAKNQKTAMHVAEARGALILTITQQNIELHEFTPKQVKIAVTGDGAATKQQVMMMIPRLIAIEKSIAYDDEYDAIAVGLTASAILSSRY